MVTALVVDGPVDSTLVVSGAGILELSLVVVELSVDVGELDREVGEDDDESVTLGVSVTVQADWQLNMVSGDWSPGVLRMVPAPHVLLAHVAVLPLA